MFESVKHWFDSLEKESKLFNNADEEALHSALASVLFHIINADNQVVSREKHRFATILKQEFDLDDEQIPGIASVVVNNKFDGLIATNTTISRDAVKGLRHADEQGGLSGTPVRERANHVLAAFRAALPAEIALIGTGGITEGEDAAEKIRLGADLVQFYTGFVYRGPDLVADCLKAIAADA